MSIRAILFDVYGTLLDVQGLTPLLDRHAPGLGESISTLWSQRQIDYTRLRTQIGKYEPFDRVTADGLDFACAKFGIDLGRSARDQLLRAYNTLPVHSDVRGMLVAQRLAAGSPVQWDGGNAGGGPQGRRYRTILPLCAQRRQCPQVQNSA